VQREARQTALHGAISGRTELAPENGDRWKSRLDRVNSYPTKQEMDSYLRETATFALEKVAVQMRARGYDAVLLTSELPDVELPQLDLQVTLEHERKFRYQLFPITAESPDFTPGDDDEYYRLEVYDLTGSLGYDVYGYSENQLINNVLDLYERHLAFLYMQQTQPGDSDVSDGAEPEPTWQEDS
ncbi:high-affinity choline transporter BetT, partial [Corynebacterium striatum]